MQKNPQSNRDTHVFKKIRHHEEQRHLSNGRSTTISYLRSRFER